MWWDKGETRWEGEGEEMVVRCVGGGEPTEKLMDDVVIRSGNVGRENKSEMWIGV